MPVKPVVVVGYSREQVIEWLEQKAEVVIQEQQLGTGHAFACALKVCKAKKVLLLNGDIALVNRSTVMGLLDGALDSKVGIVTTELEDFEAERSAFEKFGRIVRDSLGTVKSIVEYKDADEEQRKLTEVNGGVYLFDREWVMAKLDELNDDNEAHEYYITDFVKMAYSEKEKVFALKVDYKQLFGVNTPEELELVKEIMEKNRV